MQVSAKFSINAGHENLPGLGYPEYSKRDLYYQRSLGIDAVRVAVSSAYYQPAVAQTKQYALDAVAVGYPIVIWGIGKKNNKWKSSEWADLKSKLIEAYEWAQDNGITHFQIGNEDDAWWAILNEAVSEVTRVGNLIRVKTGTVAHGFAVGESVHVYNVSPLITATGFHPIVSVPDSYTFTFNTTVAGQDGTLNQGTIQPSISIPRDRYKALATELKALAGNQPEIVYSVAQGYGTNWNSGKGDIDILGLNIYGEGSTPEARFDNFKSQIDQILINHPDAWVTEWGLHASYGSYPIEYDEAKYWFKKRYQYLEQKVTRHFFFNWRSNSHAASKNDNFAMQITWDKLLKGPYNITDTRWIELFLS